MSETVLTTVTLSKDLPDRRRFSATAQLVHLSGNDRPYFSVTGEERNLRRRGDNQVESCGAVHADVLAHFPVLSPVVALHLADDRGMPMYAVQNGGYFLGFTEPCADGAPDFDTFARLWRVDMPTARTIFADCVTDADPLSSLRVYAGHRYTEWQREADNALALIIKLAKGQEDG